MKNILFCLLLLSLALFFITPRTISAACIGYFNCPCQSSTECDPGLSCQISNITNKSYCLNKPKVNNDFSTVFGTITPPQAIQDLGVGSLGISKFFNNLIILIYTIAIVIFVFMFLWGAVEWLTSGGNKEAVGSARQRIIHAIIGMILLAVAFAILSIISRFTGINFFVTVGSKSCNDRYYPQNINGQDECVHEYATDNRCIYVYEVVDKSLCH